jgi:hypothetical protein
VPRPRRRAKSKDGAFAFEWIYVRWPSFVYFGTSPCPPDNPQLADAGRSIRKQLRCAWSYLLEGWFRLTSGLEMEELWAQFKSDASEGAAMALADILRNLGQFVGTAPNTTTSPAWSSAAVKRIHRADLFTAGHPGCHPEERFWRQRIATSRI